jgi:hypothetical protein
MFISPKGGCGAFGGYHDLKAVIQLLSAAEAGVDLKYYTFGTKGLGPSLLELCLTLKVCVVFDLAANPLVRVKM